MADLNREDVLKLAKLARLHLNDEEVEKYKLEISAILQYVEQLQELDIENLEPTYQVTGLTNITRADKEIEYGADQTELLKNLPASEGGQIKVRRVL